MMTLKDNDGKQPIHEAAISGNIDVLQHLIIRHKVDPRTPSQVDNQLITSLYCSALTAVHCTALRIYMSSYFFSNILLCSQSGMQAIHYAAVYGQVEVLTSLIDHFEVDPTENSPVSTMV